MRQAHWRHRLRVEVRLRASIEALAWLCTLGVLAHNAEEALFLPTWSAHAGRWHRPVSSSGLRFAVLVLSLLLVALAAAAPLAGPRGVAAYLFAGCLFATVLNVVAPHVIATLALRRYAPGTATAVLLNLPLGGLFPYRPVSEGYAAKGTFAWVAPLSALTLVASMPILFAIGRRFPSSRE